MSIGINRLIFLSLVSTIVGFGFASIKLQAEVVTDGKIKNVILIIGDGMGPQQVGLLEAYAKQAPHSIIKNRTTAFSRMLEEGGVLGVSMTHAANVLGTDSAASATQLATGKPSSPGMIGMGADGNPHETMLEIAKKLGKSTGLVSDTRITHATPAAFAAHQLYRSRENEIAEDLLHTGPDVMFSGGLRHWIPEQANDKNSRVYQQLERMTQGAVKIKSKRKDSRNLLDEAQKQGYQLAFTKSQMEEAKGKILGLFAYSAFPDAITEQRAKIAGNYSRPSLKEMSVKAIDVLEKNDKGFFLMIEAGLIDWAAHYNDTGTLLHEMLKINETLDAVLDWVKNRDDTLIIVTADHETGGFGLSIPIDTLSRSALTSNNPKAVYNFGDPDILDKIYNQKLSYRGIFSGKFETLPEDQQTPLQLMKIVNQNTEFDITELEAARILATEKNPFYIKGHKYLGSKEVPRIDANDAFFGKQSGNRNNLLAMAVATRQAVVWSTGTHTATPVLVFSKGSHQATAPFVQLMSHIQLGQKIIEVLKGKQ